MFLEINKSLIILVAPEDIEKRPNSIGRPFLTDELYIINDDYKQVGPNQPGRIAGNEEAGFFQYSNRPEATNRAKRHELIISEDIGYTDNEGYFYVSGRQQDCVVINGETLFIPDIESKLRKHPSTSLVSTQKDC
jgi:acyl-CoA synthetase (AMP-forming)/AMP-acid ligase II